MQEEEKGIYEFDLNYLINHIPGGIAIYKLADPLKILYFNDGVCALSGHSREEYWEIVESDAIEIVLEEDRKELNNEIIAAVSENRKIDATYRIRHKDGGVVWIHLSALRIREEGGFPIYYAIFMDISEERNTQRHLSELAERDSLTGALNRISFEQKIEKYLSGHETDMSAFLMLDIDNFKQINDFLGHTKGDEILCRITKLLKETFGEGSFVARMGGDEFAVFVTGISMEEELTMLIQKFFRISCAEYDYQDSKIYMSCSMGISRVPKDGFQYMELYTKADKVLLFAKNNGKNQYRFFGELMSTPSSLLLRNMEWLLDEGTNAIYICNVENYELLYMNKLARQMANTQGNTYIGKKCYKELMHLNDPCPFCKISSMKRESFCERRFKVPYSGTELLMKGKIINWNGIKAHVEFIMDISKYRMIE
ncbi:diguanylate cyclase domain-containing protein [Robinsoniella peoriensis]|uniref:Cyclic di-GMP phosphodiesterase Gmr n=1 Tax=Robinsoniella peoriensis TaxID=180332 RepID=A0A4U8PYV4_9FIRM|nr:diguanylate cyclase [Robinsoniella peoriensis]MDU7028990.1 diguanylate cyclase [Clostridiales bacterium]TLC97561.1 Cyclic di-GMP phosphodiesterase Gmr [Robinsoniella peoriensis]